MTNELHVQKARMMLVPSQKTRRRWSQISALKSFSSTPSPPLDWTLNCYSLYGIMEMTEDN